MSEELLDRIANVMADTAQAMCESWDRTGVPPWQGECDFGPIADAALRELGLSHAGSQTTNTELSARIAAVMEAHDVNSDCQCHDYITNWFDHMADAILAMPGIAVVELPEPVYGPDGGGQFGWDTAISTVTATPDEDGYWSVWDQDFQMEPHEARDLAAALLAAAEYAERDQ
ncbi:MAG: hypothetical protein KC491_01125 [Dehalococcoidia bacterium]|nr:hypothetical protein [Dehalococcoidia bacterium]